MTADTAPGVLSPGTTCQMNFPEITLGTAPASSSRPQLQVALLSLALSRIRDGAAPCACAKSADPCMICKCASACFSRIPAPPLSRTVPSYGTTIQQHTARVYACACTCATAESTKRCRIVRRISRSVSALAPFRARRDDVASARTRRSGIVVKTTRGVFFRHLI